MIFRKTEYLKWDTKNKREKFIPKPSLKWEILHQNQNIISFRDNLSIEPFHYSVNSMLTKVNF